MTVNLVTGVAGFIGYELAKKIISSNNIVIGIDNFYSGSRKKVKDLESVNFYFYEGSITDYSFIEKVFNSHKIDYVFHQAAISSVGSSIEDPIQSNHVNLLGTLNLLNFSSKYNISRFIFASSAAVYGVLPELPKNELSATSPISPYALEKLTSEYYLDLFSKLYDLQTIKLRYFNVYGKGQNPNNEYSGVISIFHKLFTSDQIPTIFGNGNQYRDFIHVSDIVEINIAASKIEYSNKIRLICCGTGTKTSVNEIFALFCEKFNKNWKPIYKKERKGDIFGSYSDNNLMSKILKNKNTKEFKTEIMKL